LDAQALACRLLIAVFEAGGVQLLELLDQPVELIGVLGGGGAQDRHQSKPRAPNKRDRRTEKRCLLMRSLL
jgi:hypothetical protein